MEFSPMRKNSGSPTHSRRRWIRRPSSASCRRTPRTTRLIQQSWLTRSPTSSATSLSSPPIKGDPIESWWREIPGDPSGTSGTSIATSFGSHRQNPSSPKDCRMQAPAMASNRRNTAAQWKSRRALPAPSRHDRPKASRLRLHDIAQSSECFNHNKIREEIQ